MTRVRIQVSNVNFIIMQIKNNRMDVKMLQTQVLQTQVLQTQVL